MNSYILNPAKNHRDSILTFFNQLKLHHDDYIKLCSSILPLILAQILQRLYFVVDNHYIAILGNQALLIHNIQFSFLYIGQYIGAATATSCLVFWRRQAYNDRRGAVFYTHILLCIFAAIICMGLADTFSHKILQCFSVQKAYSELAKKYFDWGLINMVLQSVFISLFGVSVASGKEKLTLTISGVILIIAVIVDRVAVTIYFNGTVAPVTIYYPMLIIVTSNTILLILAIITMLFLNNRKIESNGFFNFKEIVKIWLNELGGGFLTSIDPIIYIFQLGFTITVSSLLITYQLLIQLTAIFCIPLLATMQISIRDASESFCSNKHASLPDWLKTLIVFGLIPTVFLLLIFLVLPSQLIFLTYNYVIPKDHLSYVVIYIFASIIGQFGNALTVPTRAKKNSHLVTLAYFLSDYFVLLAGMQIIIFFHIATPFSAGIVMLLFTIFYTIVNASFASMSVSK